MAFFRLFFCTWILQQLPAFSMTFFLGLLSTATAWVIPPKHIKVCLPCLRPFSSLALSLGHGGWELCALSQPPSQAVLFMIQTLGSISPISPRSTRLFGLWAPTANSKYQFSLTLNLRLRDYFLTLSLQPGPVPPSLLINLWGYWRAGRCVYLCVLSTWQCPVNAQVTPLAPRKHSHVCQVSEWRRKQSCVSTRVTKDQKVNYLKQVYLTRHSSTIQGPSTPGFVPLQLWSWA